MEKSGDRMKEFFLVYTDSLLDSESCSKDHMLFSSADKAMRYIIKHGIELKARTQIVYLNEGYDG